MYWCSYQIHWHTCDPESHPFSFHCHKEDKLESVLKQRTCCQWNLEKFAIGVKKQLWPNVPPPPFIYFGVLSQFYCAWLSGKFATGFKQWGTNHSAIFFQKNKRIQTSLTFSNYLLIRKAVGISSWLSSIFWNRILLCFALL